MSEIRTALKEKDTDTALRLAHNLKGVSGNIGADKLAAATQDLETGIKNKKRKNLDSLLQTVENEFGTVLVSIKQIADVAAAETRASNDGTHDMKKAAEMAHGLMHLIETFDTRALDEFANLKEILAGTPVSEEISELERLLGRYEFNGAIPLLKDIMKKLELDDTTAISGAFHP